MHTLHRQKALTRQAKTTRLLRQGYARVRPKAKALTHRGIAAQPALIASVGGIDVCLTSITLTRGLCITQVGCAARFRFAPRKIGSFNKRIGLTRPARTKETYRCSWN
jgi:hypothetical protein